MAACVRRRSRRTRRAEFLRVARGFREHCASCCETANTCLHDVEPEVPRNAAVVVGVREDECVLLAAFQLHVEQLVDEISIFHNIDICGCGVLKK
jgi:hypothetical protein